MCSCTKTTQDILKMVNQRRSKAGLDEVQYHWVINKWHEHAPFLQPYQTIGRSYIWDGNTARKIVGVIWKLSYTPEHKLFRWSRYVA